MGKTLLDFLHRPMHVFIACLIFISIQLVMTGSLWEMLQLSYRKNEITESLRNTNTELLRLNSEVQSAKDPAQIRKKAMDLYDWVSEDSLVFVFSE